jgi:hypothetical protein
MMDLMVSMAVISVLIAMLLPAVSKVRESTQRVICGHNLRQIGMGMSVYTQDNSDRLPDSVFLPQQRPDTASLPSLHRMDTVRVTQQEFDFLRRDELWDGLGMLYDQEYVTASNSFYCPSHSGNFMFEDGEEEWNVDDAKNEIVINYIFRGTGPDGRRVLYNIEPSAGLVTDTLRSYEDLNHERGFNVLQAGLAVNWFADSGDQIAQDILLRSNEDDGSKSNSVVNAWDRLDGLDDSPPSDDDGNDGTN